MQKRKGISLIVLVITIIVMVILAGAVILTINNSGIINKASGAVDQTNEAQVEEVAQLGWAEAYTEGARTEEELEAGVIAILERNGINPDEYLINVTTKGVKIKLLRKAWVKRGFTVVRGDQVLEIGDPIAYDETAGGTKTVEKNVDWKVLGADDDGNLLIVSETAVKIGVGLGKDSLEKAKNDCRTAISQLNAICEPYGYGKGAVHARSITIEDINGITGYVPTVDLKGESLTEYGNIVTYTWRGRF